MNHNVKELIEQEKQIQTMKCGHPLMEGTEKINVTWAIKQLISDVSKIQSVSMEKNQKDKYSETSVLVLTWIMNVMCVTQGVKMEDVFWMIMRVKV